MTKLELAKILYSLKKTFGIKKGKRLFEKLIRFIYS